MSVVVVNCLSRFQPDYTLSEMNEVLTLNTNIGVMTYPIVVRIAPNVLSFCYQSIPRPVWELRSYYLCLCSLSVFIVLLFTAAVFEARSLFDNVSEHCVLTESENASFRFALVLGSS